MQTLSSLQKSINICKENVLNNIFSLLRLMEYDYVFKIILVGDTCVGKTCFLEKIIEGHYNFRHEPTIGVDFRLVYHKTDDDTIIKCHVWDTAGQEQFQCITRSYYKGAGAIIFMYDTSEKKTFDNIEKWYKIVEAERGTENLPLLLVGTKLDKTRKEVSREAGEKLAKKYNMDFFEISSRSGENVEMIIPAVADKIKKEIVDKQIKSVGVKAYKSPAEKLKEYRGESTRLECCTIS